MHRTARKLWKDRSGAVAPIVAITLTALIATSGLAFDYAHMEALDTELQDAADQAALAAATQLDGTSGSINRATVAAQSLLANNSLFASDTSSDPSNPRKVTIATVNFYTSYNDSTDTYGSKTTTDSQATVVQVIVAGRRASFAFTPIVGALNSGTITTQATAGMSSAICNVPPLMVCQPSAGFPSSSDIGKGVLLQPGPSSGSWAPGDYGYLDFGSGASSIKAYLGMNSNNAGCFANPISTEPGNIAGAPDVLNTRLDLYTPSLPSSSCDAAGDYCPSQNTRKDLVKTEIVAVAGTSGTVPTNPGCGAAGASVSAFNQGTATKGYPRDTCHINGNCTGGNFGDGVWDSASFIAAEHPNDTVASIAAAMNTTSAALTRYNVYEWELANQSTRLATKLESSSYTFKAQGNGKSGNGTYTFTNQCAYPHPVNATGVSASVTQKDRRILTVATADCTGLNGKGNVTVTGFMDVLLVEASLNRSVPYATGQSQIYGEIIGPAQNPNGQSGLQLYLRQRPRLIR